MGWIICSSNQGFQLCLKLKSERLKRILPIDINYIIIDIYHQGFLSSWGLFFCSSPNFLEIFDLKAKTSSLRSYFLRSFLKITFQFSYVIVYHQGSEGSDFCKLMTFSSISSMVSNSLQLQFEAFKINPPTHNFRNFKNNSEII